VLLCLLTLEVVGDCFLANSSKVFLPKSNRIFYNIYKATQLFQKMKVFMTNWFWLVLAFSSPALGDKNQSILIDEEVYVESPTDTDGDGKLDLIYAKVSRPSGATDLPVIFSISPYSLGGNNVPNHNVDVTRLPQDSAKRNDFFEREFGKKLFDIDFALDRQVTLAAGYADVTADSVGTGRSKGCPTVGDMAETLAAKAVIDWLNGRARAFNASGTEVFATWSNGNVGMSGVSYNGTLPTMVATTGVEGLKAIIPIAAISNWYNYYRANGLVVGPGGYIGEDADVLGKFIVRRNACSAEMSRLTSVMGREHGDFSPFWAERNYLPKADQVTAATFIVHGQSDWNVKQRHATELWSALDGQVPVRMWLHSGGHSSPSRSTWNAEKFAWFDRFVKGVNNGVEQKPRVEVQYGATTWAAQDNWPLESTSLHTFYLNESASLSTTSGKPVEDRFTDRGKTQKLEALVLSPSNRNQGRLAFLSAPLARQTTISGAAEVNLEVALPNRKGANITVALVEYRGTTPTIVTRGWADPQNHNDITRGTPLAAGEKVNLRFSLEPKQYRFAAGSRIGIVVTSTDYDYTMRPDQGTEIILTLGAASSVNMMLDGFE
jgi:X-Pro dipeptidyl-peptidase